MSVNNLLDGTTHEFRIYGRNDLGTIDKGDVLELTTGDVATAVTLEASNRNPNSVTLNGELFDLGGNSSVEVGFGYQTNQNNESYDNLTSTQTFSSPGTFSQTVSGLSQDTYYDFAAFVDVNGTKRFGEKKTVYTPFKPFTVKTQEASNPTENSVQFNGRLEALGKEIGQFSRRSEVNNATLRFQHRDSNSTPEPYSLETAGLLRSRSVNYNGGAGDGVGAGNFPGSFEFDPVGQNNRGFLQTISGMSEDGSSVFRLERDGRNQNDRDIYVNQYSLAENYDIRTVQSREARHFVKTVNYTNELQVIRFHENGTVATLAFTGRDQSNNDRAWAFKFELGSAYDFSTVQNTVETEFISYIGGRNLMKDLFFSQNGNRSIFLDGNNGYFELHENVQPYVFDPSAQTRIRRFNFGLIPRKGSFYQNGNLYVYDGNANGFYQFSIPADFDFSNTGLTFKTQVLGGVESKGFFDLPSNATSKTVVDGGKRVFSENNQVYTLEWNTTTRTFENSAPQNISISDEVKDGIDIEFKTSGINSQRDFDEGSLKTVSTPDVPTVSTKDVSGLEPKSVTLNANLEDLGGETSVDVGFEIRQDADKDGEFTNGENFNQTSSLTEKTASGSFSETVSIEQDNFYEVRAKVVDSGGTTRYGKPIRFYAPIQPLTVETKSATLDGQTATLEGRLDSKGRRGPFDTTQALRQRQPNNANVTLRYRKQGQEGDPYDFRQGGFIRNTNLNDLRDKKDFIDNAKRGIRFGGFNPAGDKVYFFTEDDFNALRVGQYTLSENYDISSVSGKEAEILIDSNGNSNDSNPLRFYQNGTVAASTYGQNSFKINLNTAYDLRDGGTVTTRSHNTVSGTLVYSEDGSKALFQREDNSQRVRLFENLSTNYALDVEQADNPTKTFRFPETRFDDFNFHYELISSGDDKLYVFPEDERPEGRVLQYSVSTRFDLSSRSFETEELILRKSLPTTLRRKNFKFEDGGRRMYGQRGSYFTLAWNVLSGQAERPSEITNFEGTTTKTLEDGQTYEYQALGNTPVDNDIDRGQLKTFTVEDGVTVSIDSVSSVGISDATFSGTVEDLGGQTEADVGFELKRELDNLRFKENTYDVSGAINGGERTFAFRPDGSRFYVGDSGDGVVQFDLSTAFDITSVSGSQRVNLDSFSFTNDLQGIFFKPDGTKLFVIDSNANTNSYVLPTPWDVTTITQRESTEFQSAGNSRDVFFKPDGKVYYIVDLGNEEIDQYKLSSAWDLSGNVTQTGTLNTDSKTNGNDKVVGRNRRPSSVEFSSDGTRLYVGDNGQIYVYELTNPWNVETAVPLNSVDYQAEEYFNSPLKGISIVDNSERLFGISDGETVREYEGPYRRETSTQTVTSAGETFQITISSLAPDSDHTARAFGKAGGTKTLSASSLDFRTDKDVEIKTKTSVSNVTEDAATVEGRVERSDFRDIDVAFEWREKGTSEWNRTYLAGKNQLDNDTVNDNNTRTPLSFKERIGELGSKRFVSENIVGNKTGKRINGLAFNGDGSKGFILDRNNSRIAEFALSTNYEFSTASYTGNELKVRSDQNFTFVQSGSRLVTFNGNDAVEYRLDTDYDITTAVKIGREELAPSSGLQSGTFTGNGNLVTLHRNPYEIRLHSLTEGFSVSKGATLQKTALSGDLSSPRDLQFNSDGTKLVIVSRNSNSDGNEVSEYTLSTAYDVSTISSTGNGFDPSGRGRFRAVASNPNEKEFYFGTARFTENKGVVYKYTTPTAFDFSAITFDSKAYSPEENGIVPEVKDVAFRTGGSSVFVLQDDFNKFQDGYRVSEVPLSTDYDLSTQQQAVASSEINVTNGNPVSMTFSEDGTRMYLCTFSDPNAEEYKLNTAWDLSTISRVGVANNIGQNNNANVNVVDGGRRAYVSGRTDNNLTEYYLAEQNQIIGTKNFINSYDLSNEFNRSFLNHSLDTNQPVETQFTKDGKRAYHGDGTGTVTTTNFDEPFLTETSNRSENKWAFGSGLNIRGLDIREEESEMFLVSESLGRVRTLDISPLQGSTTYEYRAVAVAGGDEQTFNKKINREEFFGQIREFSTAADVSISTNSENNLEPQSASFNGDLLETGSSSTVETLFNFKNSLENRFRRTARVDRAAGTFAVGRGAYDIGTVETTSRSEITFTEVENDSSLQITEAQMGEAGRYVHVLTGNANNPTELYQYALESAYDLSTATYQGKQFELKETAQGRIWYGDGGNKAYFVEDSNNQNNFADRHIRQYDLENQYDFTGAVRFTGRFIPEKFDDNNSNRSLNNIRFNGDGTVGFASTGGTMAKFSMTASYDITTASQTNFTNKNFNIENREYWEFTDSGNSVVTYYNVQPNSFVKFELDAAYDIFGTNFSDESKITQKLPRLALTTGRTRNFVDGGNKLFIEAGTNSNKYKLHQVGLRPNQQHSYKAVARTKLSRAEGSEITFTTPQEVEIETKSATEN